MTLYLSRPPIPTSPQKTGELFFHTKQSLLFNDNAPWNKKHSTTPFDATMGSFDAAETCKLVGSYLLNQLPVGIRNQIGLYKDDGLGAFQQTPKEIERIKKEMCKVFSSNGLKITIEANKKIVNFLDVTLNLNKGTYEPYAKPNNTPLYVHRESNQPHSYEMIIANLASRNSQRRKGIHPLCSYW